MPLNPDKFSKIAESLRQYRRAELADFINDVDKDPVGVLYVDPLESNAVLNTVTQNNTTFVIGRKGTGKSTVFVKAQLELRKRSDAVSVYIDVKSLHEILNTTEAVVQNIDDQSISKPILAAHQLRKAFLAEVINELIKELKRAYETQNFIKRWVGIKRDYNEVIAELEVVAQQVRNGKLSAAEIPILQTITIRSIEANSQKDSLKTAAKGEIKIAKKPELRVSANVEGFDESVADQELYQEYADVVLRSFPFQELLEKIKELLEGAGLKRLFVFFDDFSELSWIDQKLFVDVILSPLNNASDEKIKLKVAGYPGRVYYGKIDPGKIDTVGLDFYQIYKAADIQTSEAAGMNYLQRLLQARFDAFEENIANYFDPSIPLADIYRLLFEITLNVPRLIGYILHYCYLDRVSKGQFITLSSLRLAAQKYYSNITAKYFDRMNRFSLEPFERKLDRHNQSQLLLHVIQELRSVRRDIISGKIGGKYFEGLPNPPASHFAIHPSLEQMFSALELNFMVTKYHEMRDKSGNDVSIYALSYGLCEAERVPWGYPRGRRDDRSYFVQRCFNYNSSVQQFLAKSQTLRCDNCGASFGMDKRENIEFYKWKCPECHTGICSVVTLGDELEQELNKLQAVTKLPSVELEILETLNEEGIPMRASEIAQLVDTTYQMVGHRTSKLQQMGLVEKKQFDTIKRSSITEKGKDTYFG